MQLEIFSSQVSGAASGEAPVAVTELPPVKMLTIGERMAALWADYCAAVDAWGADVGRLAGVEQTISRCEHYMAAIQPFSEHDLREMKRKVAVKLRDRMVRHAEQEFAPPGGRVEIDRSRIHEEFPCERSRDEESLEFDFAGMWRWLENQYGGDAGIKLANQQVADAIIKAFSMRASDEVEERGGFIVLRDRVWMDDHDKKWHKVARLAYGAQESVIACINALAGFARWAERHVLVADLRHLAYHFADRSTRIESRKRFSLGHEGAIVVVTMQTQFEYLIRKDVAEQLQIFLSTYGTMRE